MADDITFYELDYNHLKNKQSRLHLLIRKRRSIKNILKSRRKKFSSKIRRRRKFKIKVRIRRRRFRVTVYRFRRYRWRKLRRRRILFVRKRFKRKLRKLFKWNKRKDNKLYRVYNLFLYSYYSVINSNPFFFLMLLARFNIYELNIPRPHWFYKRFWRRSNYSFDKMLLNTYWIKQKKYLIITVGLKRYLPDFYNHFAFKLPIIRSFNNTSFFTEQIASYKNLVTSPLILLKNFKKNNLMLKDVINNTDLFLKLAIQPSLYNVFIDCSCIKLIIPNKINITSHQIALLKKIRLRVYSMYAKKARNYKITKFFLKFSNSSVLTNWLVNWEFQLVNVLLRAKFIRKYTLAVNLISEGYIFINSKVQVNPYYNVTVGDVIQIPISKNWFLFDRKQTSFFNKFIKNLHMYVTKNKLGKVKFHLNPAREEKSWFLEQLRNLNKTPAYLEVDYVTLTIVVIKKNISITETLPIYSSSFKPLVARLYNWRYFY